MDAIILLSLVPVRANPSERAELVTQFLFGETLDIIEKQEEWTLVKSNIDQYEGWINNTQYHSLNKAEAGYLKALDRFHNPYHNLKISVDGTTMLIGFGAIVPKNGQLDIAGIQFSFPEIPRDKVTWKATILSWLNTPYLWGGKGVYGIDCSGFTQLCMAANGVNIPRDAYQQANCGKTIEQTEDWQEGDLAFFNKGDKITHVGILLSNNRIIHASGKVRIDKITTQGILNIETGVKTHNLCLIKRIHA